MSDIAIIGTGRLGTNLGYALSKKGHRITALADKDRRAARECRQFIGQGKVFGDNIRAARSSHWVILTVPDDAIAEVADELAGSAIDWRNKFVFHCSGLHTTSLLDSLGNRGAWVASLHPVLSFPQKKPDAKIFEGIYFGLEGKEEALQLAIGITRQLGAEFFILQPGSKPLYHTACSMASNFMATILDAAEELLLKAGLDAHIVPRILMPLVQGTLQNVNKFDAENAMTGPVARGDITSVEKHLESLRGLPEFHDLYISIAKRSLQIARRKKSLPEEKIRAMEAMLADK